MQLIGQACALACLAIEALDDFAQVQDSGRGLGCGAGSFQQREPGGTQTLDGIGLAFGKQSLAIMLIACGFAHGDRLGERQTP